MGLHIELCLSIPPSFSLSIPIPSRPCLSLCVCARWKFVSYFESGASDIGPGKLASFSKEKTSELGFA